MANYRAHPSAPPDPLSRRGILYGRDVPPPVVSAYGRMYLKLNRFFDALDFFEQVRDEEGLAEIRRWAVREGETAALLRIRRLFPDRVSAAELESCADAAEGRGRLLPARAARAIARGEPPSLLPPEKPPAPPPPPAGDPG